MDAKKRNLQRILSLAVVVLLLLGAFAPSALIFVDDSSNTAVAKISEDNIKGENDWTITGTRYINVSKSQDSNIIIDGGRLEINNATLTMLLDEWNAWEIKVRNGGELILWNSTIKTQSRNSQLGPILKMNVSAYGGSKITLRHDSSFTFPGWIYLDNSDLTLKDSSFDKLPDDQIPNTLSLDDNNDCPMLTAKDGSDVLIEDSEINNYYKNEELEGMDWYPSAMGTDTTNEDPNNLTDNTPYKIESGEQMNITQWSHDPYYPLKDYRYVNPYDKISALYIVMNYDVENGYSANDQVYYNTPSGQKQAMQVTSLNPDTDHDIWEIDLNQFKRSGDIFLKNLTVTLTNTDPLNITVQDIKLVSAYNNDINLIDSDMTVINSYIDVDYETADPDPRDEAMYNPPETGTTSETWLEDSSLTHRTLRLYNSSLKGYGLSPSGTWEPSGDPIIVADEKSKNKTWIYRWVTVTPRDSTGTPLNKTDLTVDLSSTISDMSTDLYNNVVAANDPTNNQEAWEYFNKNDFGNYDVGTGTYATNDKGQLTVFLISDRINHPDDWKNGKFVGEYDFDAVHPELGLAQENISLEAFPNLNESANHMYLDILYDDEIDHPDLMVRDSGLNVKYMGTNITYSTIDADLDISLDVNNIGTLNSTNVKVSFYLDDTTNMIDSVVIPRLNKSETKQVSIDWQPTETGTHDIIALVDPDNEMLELRENNNEASTTIDIGEKPNLILNDIFVDAPVIDYTPANEIWIMNHTSRADLSASVSNIGGNAGIMDDATNVRVTFYYANNNTVIGYRDGIDLSETGDSTTTIPIDWNYPGPGDYTIRAMVDSEMVVSEGNETNNNETQKIVVKEGPDVIPSTLSVDPTDPHEDTMVEFSCWVSNVGGWDSGNINVTFSVDGEPVGYGEAPSLSPGGSPVEINHMWLAEIEGKALSQVRTVSVSVTEDSGYETITGNNSASTTITIQKPAELSVADLTLSSSTEYLQVNQSIDITADIMNSGGEDITDANVVFYKGEPSSGNIIDSALVSVPADSNQSVTVSWETQDRGNHWIYVTVSEDQASVKAPIFSEDYQYDLIVDDENSPYEINGNFGINGFIVVKETGRLIIEGERGQAELDMMMDNPGEFSIFVTDNGQMTLSNTVIYSDLDFDIIVDEQGTFTSSQNSFIYPSAKIHGTDDCSLNFMDSEVESYIDIKGGTFTSEGTSFNSPSLDIAPSRIDCTNSSFADDLNDFNDTRGSLTAVEVDSIDMTGNSRIMLYRWLEVNTVSNSSISINGAEVVISSQLTDYQASGVSDSDGMVYIPALTNILTSGDFTFVGNYLIDSTYSVDSGEYTIDPTVQMKLPDYPSTENIIPVTLRFETLYIPDLHVEGESVTTDIGEVTVGQPVQISAEIENLGEADASDVNVRFYLDGVDEPIGEEVISIRSGEIETSSITWTSTMDETMDEHTRTIRVYVDPNVSPINDANVANNEGETSITVKSLPNPEFTSDINLMVDEEVIDPINITEGDELNISFSVLNSGGTDLINTSVRIQNTDYTIANKKMDILVDEEVTVYTDWLVDISGGDNLVVSLNTSEYSGISISQSLGITIDPLQLEFQEPDIPDTKQEKNQQITIQGTLLRRQDNKPMEGITVNASLVDENDNEVGSIASGETNANGRYTIFITTPNKAGEYRVQLTAEHPNFEDAHVSDQSFQVTGGEGGIPLWLIAVILVAAAGASFGGILLYLRYKGLGEWVECGECGATIPADSNKCPKCGTEFEMDTVKCSECGEWIPADADACPHCGAEFIMTGEEVEEYSDRMKEQYEKYVDKHRKEAKKELGDEFSEDNFMDWWEEQPTYLTFDEWLEREEERRRKGGIECPECGALNSVDDAICHKCGSTLIHVGEEKPSPGLPELEDEEEKPKKKVKPKKKIEKPEKKEEKAPEKAEEEKKKVKPKKVQKKVKKKPKRVAKKVKKKVVKKPGEEEEE